MNDLQQIICGDALEELRKLPAKSVQCCVTSPPYWGLRDYGTAQWEGGDDGCDHQAGVSGGQCRADRAFTLGEIYKSECGKCGAKRIDSQLGLEKDPESYVAKMVEVFREVRRVLRKDGTLWLNLGSSYAGSGKGGNPEGSEWSGFVGNKDRERSAQASAPIVPPGFKPKDLVPIPWMVAMALQADGWWLRSDIIWAKSNPMPESVTDRPTKSHEYLFLLTKSANYFYDSEAIKEPSEYPEDDRKARVRNGHKSTPSEMLNGLRGKAYAFGEQTYPIRNKRSVWTVATAPYPEAHFATYPPDLIKPCILAGTSAKGCCAKCGAPWERIVKRQAGTTDAVRPKAAALSAGGMGNNGTGRSTLGTSGTPETWHERASKVQTLGWQPTCGCTTPMGGEFPIKPCTVLDPFAGSGTTGAVALELGRKAVLIELNPKYVELIEQRCCVTPGLQLA